MPGAPGMPPAPPAKQGTSGLSITGFVFAFVIPPLGLILSIIGAVRSGRRGQKKGLAIAGIILAVIFTAGGTAVAVTAGGKAATLTDPGCVNGKAAIISNQDKIASDDPATAKTGLQATIDGLKPAIAQAKHDNVRAALQAYSDDASELLNDINAGTTPSADLPTKSDSDIDQINSLCSVGTK
jgi:hypothetical protein